MVGGCTLCRRLSSKWIRLLDGDRCGGKARAVIGRSKALRWAAQYSPWQTTGALLAPKALC